MRIWLAPSSYFPHRGGVEELTHQLALGLQRATHSVLVVAPRHPSTLPAVENLDGVTVRRFRFKAPRMALIPLLTFPLSLGRQVLGLVWAMRSERPDVVHIQCPSVQVPAVMVAAWLMRVPVVLTSQGEVEMDAHDLYGRSRYMRFVLRRAAVRAARLTACSQWTVRAATKIAPSFADADVVLNGVDPAQWSVTPIPDEPVACAWGRHVSQKGFDLLIKAYEGVRQEIPDARLLIGGDGPETPRLRALAGPGVEFVGALDRAAVQRLLDRSRIAVVPSRLEPFGIVALEAMAAGRPVVWSTAGGLADATRGLGIGVDPCDAKALQDAIVASLRHPAAQADLRAVAELSSWQRIIETYTKIYEEVA